MRGVVRSFLVSLWFMALTFPIVVIKVSSLDGSIGWRWENAVGIGIGVFVLSFVWRALLVRRGAMTPREADLEWLFNWLEVERNQRIAKAVGLFIGCNAPILYLVFVDGWKGFLISLHALEVGAIVALVVAHFGMILGGGALRGKQRGAVAIQWVRQTAASPLGRKGAVVALMAFVLPLPFFMDMYQVNIISSAFIWIMLGLGLNIVVGQAGLLVLGYVAFYAVGAYTYAIGNLHFGNEFIGFWTFLPIGGLLAMLAGVLLSFPVLRLRGDYLAIVTLGFGEIVRVVLEGGSLSLNPILSLLPQSVVQALPASFQNTLDLGGPAGIGNIPYPGFFGMQLSMDDSIRLVYFVALGLTIITILAVSRLRDSRLGRSWAALREDEIACEAMGINKVTAKLSAFALGACWAGFGGVLFAAKTSFINPSSFTFMESALILSVVVLGGLDSIIGVALGACVLILLPEYLRSLNEYRMLIFGASMVLMMVFRPQGLLPAKAIKRTMPLAKEPPMNEKAGAA